MVTLNNGVTGFVHNKYVSSYGCMLVNIRSGHLNIRKSPSTRSRIVGKAKKNSALAILSYKGSWARVKTNSGKI